MTDETTARQVDPHALAEWFAWFRGRCEYSLNEACLLDVIADREAKLAEMQQHMDETLRPLNEALRKEAHVATSRLVEAEATLQRIHADFGIETDVDAYETVGRTNAAACEYRDKLTEAEATITRVVAKAPSVLRLLMASHGMHGPCRANGCSECRRAFEQARALLAEIIDDTETP